MTSEMLRAWAIGQPYAVPLPPARRTLPAWVAREATGANLWHTNLPQIVS